MTQDEPLKEISLADLNASPVYRRLLRDLTIGRKTRKTYRTMGVLKSSLQGGAVGLFIQADVVVHGVTPRGSRRKVVIRFDDAEDKIEISEGYKALGEQYLSSIVLDAVKTSIDGKRVNGEVLEVRSIEEIVRAVSKETEDLNGNSEKNGLSSFDVAQTWGLSAAEAQRLMKSIGTGPIQKRPYLVVLYRTINNN